METKFKKGDVIKVDKPELPSHLMYVLEVTEKGYKVALITAIALWILTMKICWLK